MALNSGGDDDDGDEDGNDDDNGYNYNIDVDIGDDDDAQGDSVGSSENADGDQGKHVFAKQSVEADETGF